MNKYHIICPCCQETDWVAFGQIISRWETLANQPGSQYIIEDIATPIQERICGRCGYWMELISRADDEQSVRIGGFQYTIDITPNDIPAHSQASFGRIFTIRHIESGAIKHVKLWSNSRIPEWAKEYLYDNYKWEQVH